MKIEFVALKNDLWRVICDGREYATGKSRWEAITATAEMAKWHILDPERWDSLEFVGITLEELHTAHCLDISTHGRRKGPRIDRELFHLAFAHLQTEIVPENEEALLKDYRLAFSKLRPVEALACLIALGESQECTNPFWKLIERLYVQVHEQDPPSDRPQPRRSEDRLLGEIRLRSGRRR